MAFRRRSIRRFKPDLRWDRSVGTLGVVTNGGINGVTLFDPSVFSPNLDERTSLIRCMMNISFVLDATGQIGSAGAASSFGATLFCGISVTDKNSPVNDPKFTANTDQQADWLSLWVVRFETTPTSLVGSSIITEQKSVDVRVKRKIAGNDVIVFSMSVVAPNNVNITTGAAVGATYQVSNLWMRAGRR